MDLIKEKVYENGLRVLKYKQKVFYDNLWTDELVKYRGVVMDAEDSVVSYPFDKVFNYMENDTGKGWKNNDIVLAVEKLNGFLAVVSVYEGELLISTTGTLDSDFAKLAKEVILRHGITVDMVRGYTMMFEVCHESDPHIVEEEGELYFIGARYMSTFKMVDSDQLYLLNIPAPLANFKYTFFGDLLKELKTAQIEGWMVYAQTGVLKLKTKFYLITKFLARNKKYINAFWDKDIKPKVDEEYYPLLKFIKENYTKDYWMSLNEKAKVDIITNKLRD